MESDVEQVSFQESERDGTSGHGEVHWYEAHGIGKKEFKLKWFVED